MAGTNDASDEVTLVYTTTVYVTVDLAQRIVTRVQVLDEDVEYGGTSVEQVSARALAKAVAVAEGDRRWPAWSLP